MIGSILFSLFATASLASLHASDDVQSRILVIVVIQRRALAVMLGIPVQNLLVIPIVHFLFRSFSLELHTGRQSSPSSAASSASYHVWFLRI